MSNDNLNMDSLFKEKKIIRSKVRKSHKSMDPSLKSRQVEAIQNIVLEAPWFKSSKVLCAYLSCSALKEVDTSRVLAEILQKDGGVEGRKKIYVITSTNDLIANSMEILEPAPVGADGNEREDGLPFDRSGRRLGRGGGYYDTLLKNYQKLAKERNWEQLLFVALSYSIQILDEGVIPVTANDVSIDALVSPSSVIPISPAAMARC